jgi:drug/metabolite transporter (DMT)-like permease
MRAALMALILSSVALNAIAQIILRKAMLTAGVLPSLSDPLRLATSLATNAWLWAGMSCYAVSIVLWLAVLSRVPVSAAYPMQSIGYVIAAILGVLYLGEMVSLPRAAGIGLIVCGVFLISQSA